MVLLRCWPEEVKEEPKTNSAMAKGAERTRNLHNFLLPPSWGCQRRLHCVKLKGSDVGIGNSDHAPRSDSPSLPSSSKPYIHQNFPVFSCNPAESKRKRSSFLEPENIQRSPSAVRQSPAYTEKSSAMNSDRDKRFEALIKNAMVDLQTEMTGVKFTGLTKGKEDFNHSQRPPLPPRMDKTEAFAVETRPWNLRKRRAVCKEPNGSNMGAGGRPNFKLCMAASDDPVGVKFVEEKSRRIEFSVALTKQEIQEDIIVINERPPKKGKKRSSREQRNIEMDGVKLADLSKGKEEFNPSQRPLLPPLMDKTEAFAVETRPWKLRKRRAVCKELNDNNTGAGGGPNFKLSMAARDDPFGVKFVEEKSRGVEFSVAITKQEIQEDFIAITGRPPKKAKKRPSRVQRKMDELFPGSMLCEIRADMYRFNEIPKARKR